MNLQTLGWSQVYADPGTDLDTIARITAVHRSHLRAAKNNKQLNLYLPGSLETAPVVGDWVMTKPEFIDEQGEPAAIVEKVLPRTSMLSRWSNEGEQALAANINTVFIVTSANQDLNINRLHRFILLVNRGNAEAIVILSKSDLVDNPQDIIQDLHSKLGVAVLVTSAKDGRGVNEVLAKMPEGSTSVFVGSSGVGKSSLVNYLMNDQIQITKDIRQDDAKGRHTTTARQMFLVPEHGLIIDTPGVREVQVFGDTEDVLETFPAIESLMQLCRFGNCQHKTEPGCAIQKAIKCGDLDIKDWESFTKLEREVAYAKRKNDKAEMANAKKRWKKVSQYARSIKKARER